MNHQNRRTLEELVGLESLLELRHFMTVCRATCVGLCLCLTFSISLSGQERRQQNISKSCREFVGRFYTWYLGMALKTNRSRTSDLALKSKPYLFSPDLVQQLREDSDAQEKAGSDLVSLDADAFLGADGSANVTLLRESR